MLGLPSISSAATDCPQWRRDSSMFNSAVSDSPVRRAADQERALDAADGVQRLQKSRANTPAFLGSYPENA